jgi:PAS domain S-box-containing protein
MSKFLESDTCSGLWFRLIPLRITGIYLAVSVTYILVSDSIFERIFAPEIQAKLQTFKGLIFVLLTGLLIYLLLHLALRRIVAARQGQDQLHATLSKILQLGAQLDKPLSVSEASQVACSFIVEELGYELAWVGMKLQIDSDIYPVGCAGEAKEFVNQLVARSDESQLGRGPAGTALRENRTIVSQDLASDPSYTPWLNEARAYGLRSKVSMPLECVDGVHAVLSVYSRQPQAFSEEVLRTLQTVSHMLSSAIQRAEVTEREVEERQEVLRQNRVLSEQHEALRKEFTHRLEAEENQLRSEEAHRRMLDEIAVPLAVHQNRRHVFVNQAYCNLLGFTADELLGKPLSIVWPPELRDELEQRLEARERGEPSPLNYQSVLLCKDGQRVAVNRRVVRTEFNGAPAVLWADIDISESELLRRKLQAAVEASLIAFWDFDPRTGTVTYDEDFLLLSGWDKQHLFHSFEEIASVLHPDDSERSIDMFMRALSGEEDRLDLEARFASGDGSWRWLLLRGKVVERDEDGTALRMLGTVIDTTNRQHQQANTD